MRTENKNTNYVMTFPHFKFTERASLMGYAKYMGYEFCYDREKRKALLIKNEDGVRTVLFLAKIKGKIVGIEKDGTQHFINSEMNLTKVLKDIGIFEIPKEDTIEMNKYIEENLIIIGAKICRT
jgi:hypothetical protein